MSEMAKIMQQQHIENKKLEKLFSDARRQSLQLSGALIQQPDNPPAGLGTHLSRQRLLGLITQSPDEEDSTVLGNKFLLEVNGVAGSIFKLCESHSEAHFYVKEHFVKEHPAPSNVAATDSPPSFTEVASSPPSVPLGVNRSDLFKASMLDLGMRSVTGDQSKEKEGKLFGYSVLDTVKLRNGLVLDPEHLPDIIKKHFTEQMADCELCPWSEGHGGELDG
jgi:hypothetical protein